ncbi:MAG: repeat protein [Pedosphaera sp.]|nr:repeat protein [Pedosphaera sp.]
MRKRYRILLVVLLVAVVGGLAWQVLRQREPVFQGQPLSVWLRADRHREYNPGQGPEDAIRESGTNAIPVLLRSLRAKDSDLQFKLLRFALKHRLISGPDTSAEFQNELAARGFELLGSSAKEAVPGLMKIYQQNISQSSQENCLAALASIGPTAKQAIPLLIGATSHPAFEVRYRAFAALGNVHPEPEVILPFLIRTLRDPDTGFKTIAIEQIRLLGDDAKPAIPALIELLQDPGPSVRRSAVYALGWLAPESEQVVPVLTLALQSSQSDALMRMSSATALGRIGANARSAVPALLGALHDPNPQVGPTAALALGRIAQDSEQVVPALTLSLESSESDVMMRSACAGALGKFGTNAGSAVPALLAALHDASEVVRERATTALKSIDPDAAAQAGVK